MMNKQAGNMYGFINFTWNAIKGACPHSCTYCYMKRFPQGPLHLDKKCFKDNLGAGNFIFVGSSVDMFAEGISNEWVCKVLAYCELFNNTYLFQSKNPGRFQDFHFPPTVWLGTTIETNRQDYIEKICGVVPSVQERADSMKDVALEGKMITIEPIMDFDLDPFLKMIVEAHPDQVNIGADSGNNGLPEPDSKKIGALIDSLDKITKVHIKDNLRRLYHG